MDYMVGMVAMALMVAMAWMADIVSIGVIFSIDSMASMGVGSRLVLWRSNGVQEQIHIMGPDVFPILRGVLGIFKGVEINISRSCKTTNRLIVQMDGCRRNWIEEGHDVSIEVSL